MEKAYGVARKAEGQTPVPPRLVQFQTQTRLLDVVVLPAFGLYDCVTVVGMDQSD